MGKKMLLALTALLTLAVAGCDKLEDSDMTAETLVGRWAFSYKASETIDYELAYQFITFSDDGTCSLAYEGGQLNGTYRASEAVIRIEGQLDDGKEQSMMWRVLSLSPYRIVTEYDLELGNDRHVMITVTLDRL